MKIDYEFIHFDRLYHKGVTARWSCQTNRTNDQLKAATTDPNIIRKWWAATPEAKLALDKGRK